MTLQEYATYNLGNLYDPNFPEESQCKGWLTFKALAIKKQVPTESEMTSLHVLVRQRILKDWKIIIGLKVN